MEQGQTAIRFVLLNPFPSQTSLFFFFFNSFTVSVFASHTQTAATLLRISSQNGAIDQTALADVINIQILPVNSYSPRMKSKNSIVRSSGAELTSEETRRGSPPCD